LGGRKREVLGDLYVLLTAYTKGGYGVWSPFAVSPVHPHREPLVIETVNEMAQADLVGVSRITNRIVEQIQAWMESNYQYWSCSVHSCACEEGFEGDSWDAVENTVNSYHLVAMGALGPRAAEPDAENELRVRDSLSFGRGCRPQRGLVASYNPTCSDSSRRVKGLPFVLDFMEIVRCKPT
jgi:hypothetical protein